MHNYVCYTVILLFIMLYTCTCGLIICIPTLTHIFPLYTEAFVEYLIGNCLGKQNKIILEETTPTHKQLYTCTLCMYEQNCVHTCT